MTTDITTRPLTELSTHLTAGDFTSRELTDAYIQQIQAQDKTINAYVTTTFDLARQMADASDSRRASGSPLSPLDGIPISLKDVVCTTGVRTTACSKMLEDFVPPYDATVWQKLKAAGTVLLGKVNTDEFTMGASTQTSHFGVTRNPHDTDRVAGGSSGGSAASVAAHMCAGSVGTDTGGSIRQPAAFCGITGLKVSYGRVSRYGVMPMASSLDSVGPFAQTAADCGLLLMYMAGHDPHDSTTPDVPVTDYLESLRRPLTGLRVGIPTEYLIDGIDPEVLAVFQSAKAILTEAGAQIIDISLPHTQYAIPCYYVINPSEISANLSRFDSIRFGHKAPDTTDLIDLYKSSRAQGFGPEVKRRIMVGTYALSAGYYDAYYRQAQRVRTLIRQDFDQAYQKVDVILTPTTPRPAFKVGENSSDPVQMYLEDIFTASANLAGNCGVSSPLGQSQSGLPIGVQILGKAFDEGTVLRVAHHFDLSKQ